MKIISKQIKWGSYIRKNFGDDAYKEYRKTYARIYRYKNKSGFDINVARESATFTIYGETKITQAVGLTKGITDVSEVRRISDINRLSEFIAKNNSIQIYNTNLTIGDISNLYGQGKLSREQFLDYIKAFKKSPYYLVNGS